MNNKHTNYILTGLIAIVFIFGIVLYPSFPEQIATHWNVMGEADGYTGKFWGVFLFPILMVVMFIFYFFIPKLDPLNKNIELFRSSYNSFWIWMFVFFTYIFGLSMLWNIGYRFNFTMAMVPALSVLLCTIGVILEKSKRNWFVGIRTPWTLSSDIVWDKTHKLGGKLFKIAGLVSVSGLFLHDSYAIFVIVIPIILVSLITIVYSYIEYKKLK